MFNDVRLANEDEIEFVNKLGQTARFQQPEPVIRFFSQNEVSTNDKKNNQKHPLRKN